MRYFIKLSYDGSSFCGWQFQPNAPTVQECLEKALSTLLKEKIAVTGAGRTDTAVNASRYVAHFDCISDGFDAEGIRYKLNAILPHSMVVHSLGEAAPDFHARFGATNREYTYFLHRIKDPFIEKFSYKYTYPLDIEAMNRAAAYLTGTHDFSCFEKTGADSKTSICTVKEAGWHDYFPTHVTIAGFDCSGTSDHGPAYIYFKISADRFLRNMVRAIVGTLLEVGRGKRSVEEFASLILPADGGTPAACGRANRCAAGESVPGNALFLSKVEY